jgi:glycosyltransferase involved in cell wall biosynthesis
LRIIQIIQRSQLRGAEIFALQLSSELVRLGNEVAIAVLYDTHSDLDARIESFPNFKLKANQKIKFVDVRAWIAINRCIREFKPDIVQSNAGDTLMYSAFSKKIFKWNCKLVYRNANYLSGFITGNWAKTIFYKWILKSIDYTISVSENCKSDFIETLGLKNGNICAIPIGTEIRSSVSNSNYKKSPPTSEVVILNIGSLVPEKNHIGLIRIFKKINYSLPESVLKIVGEGPLREKILDYVRESGLDDKVFLVGKHENVMPIINQCHLMLMPSIVEGLPGVILESMISQVPVVASAVGGIPEIIISGKTGFII